VRDSFGGFRAVDEHVKVAERLNGRVDRGRRGHVEGNSDGFTATRSDGLADGQAIPEAAKRSHGEPQE
jgi:hypothetical protein